MSVNNLEVRTTNQPKMSIDEVNFFPMSYLTVNPYAIHVHVHTVFTSVMFPKTGIHNL